MGTYILIVLKHKYRMKIFSFAISAYFCTTAGAEGNDTAAENDDPWHEHDVENFKQFTKFIPDVLPLLLQHTAAYSHVDIDKISNYGCWCSKLGSGRDRFGGRPSDDFDEICKRWFRLRHCLVLEGGTCRDTKALESYYVEIPKDANGVATTLSDDVHFHCYPTALWNDEIQRNCILNICRVDYIHAKMLLEKYVELDIGSQPVAVCESGDRTGEGNGRHNTCQVTDVYPFVELISTETDENRQRRAIQSKDNRLAAKFRNKE